MSLLFEGTRERTMKEEVWGIDEAGRGCLAGPVVAACVSFDWTQEEMIKDLATRVVIRDSKRMTRNQRKAAAEAIRGVASGWGVGVVHPQVIDEINILQATFEAMREAVAHAGYCSAARYIIDGNRKVPGVEWRQEAVIDGDALVFSVAAAAILAKEHRDMLMEESAKTYPAYGFEVHKGYGTKAHYAAIFAHGITPIHRKTFLKNLAQHAKE